jgi:hypothetical protein
VRPERDGIIPQQLVWCNRRFLPATAPSARHVGQCEDKASVAIVLARSSSICGICHPVWWRFSGCVTILAGTAGFTVIKSWEDHGGEYSGLRLDADAICRRLWTANRFGIAIMNYGIVPTRCRLAIQSIKTETDELRIGALPVDTTAACPLGGTKSTHVHGPYRKTRAAFHRKDGVCGDHHRPPPRW